MLVSKRGAHLLVHHDVLQVSLLLTTCCMLLVGATEMMVLGLTSTQWSVTTLTRMSGRRCLPCIAVEELPVLLLSQAVYMLWEAMILVCDECMHDLNT